MWRVLVFYLSAKSVKIDVFPLFAVMLYELDFIALLGIFINIPADYLVVGEFSTYDPSKLVKS